MPVRFTLRHDLDAAALEPAWRELESRADPPMFLGWAWIGAWLATIGAPALVLEGRAAGRVVLLAALRQATRRPLPGLAVRGLHLHNTGDEDRDVITIEYNGFLADPAVPEAVHEALHFLLGGGHCDELHLRNMPSPAGAPLYPAAALPRGTVLRELFRKPSYHIDLAALRAAGTPYLDSLSANTRQQLRRALRLFAARGALAVQRAAGVAEAMDYLAELKTLHQRYWTGRGAPGAFAYPFFEAFQHRLIATGLAEGAVELARVSCGGQPIGYVYNLMRNGRVLAYQTGIAFEDDARLKAGLVCHALCIQRHLDEGAAIYDFMAGDARYKRSMARPGPDMVYCTLEGAGAVLRLERALRGIRKRVARK